PRLVELLDELGERRGPRGSFLHQALDHLRGAVVDNARVPGPHEAPHHVGAHPSETDHSELHRLISSTQDTEITESTKITERLERTMGRANAFIYVSLCPLCLCGIRQANPFPTAAASVFSPAATSGPRWTRSARRPRSASTWKSPRACAALTIP